MAAQVIGAKVRIEVNEEGSYEGYVHNIDGTTKKLTLAKVVSCATGTRLHGLHHFFPNEINDLTVLEQKQIGDDRKNAGNIVQKDVSINKPNGAEISSQVRNEKPVVNPAQSKGRGSPFMNKRNFSKKQLQKGKSRRDPSDEGLRMLQKKKTLGQNCNSEDFIETSEDHENFTINPPNVVLINSLEEAFEQAIAYISRQRVVGVAWEGVKVGRFGQLCLVQIGCNKCIYIFDIVTLGGQAFDCGLADVMDSADILKVIHNCRHFSDVLYHQYGVSLVNVFDTQVADAIIYRNEVPDKKLPRQTSSLISCLYEYLDLSPDEYHFHKVRLKHTKDDEMVWKNRPIQNDLINTAAKTVMYLRELRLAQMERMMEEFIHGVDIYLSCVRDASDEAVKKKFSSTALPEMFYEMQSRGRPRFRQVELELESNEGEEQRQAWEEGHNFMVKYEQRGMRVREHKYPPFGAEPERSSPVPVSNMHTDNGVSNDLATEIDKLNVFEEAPKTQPEKGISMQNTSKFASGRGSLWPGNSGIFSQDDFPQLSSDSDSSGQSPRALSVMKNMRPSRDTRRGRGRAASLVRNAQLPGARRPNEKAYGLSPYASSNQYRGANQHGKPSLNIGGIGQHDRLQFPPDEELLMSSEIVSTSGLSAVPSGPRVRISHQ